MTQFSRYGNTGDNALTFEELIALQRADQMLTARAEESGNEACYCEVAQWNCLRHRWERFAFAKFFGGEHPDQPDATDVTTARLFADEINSAAYLGDLAPIISRMPDVTPVEMPTATGSEAAQ